MRRYSLLAWQTPEWRDLVAERLEEAYRAGGLLNWRVPLLDPADLSLGLRLRTELLLVLVKPDETELFRAAESLIASGLWYRADVAVVGCRVEDIAGVIEPLRLFPRWPAAWWPTLDRFAGQARIMVARLVTRKRARGRGVGLDRSFDFTRFDAARADKSPPGPLRRHDLNPLHVGENLAFRRSLGV